VFFFVATLLLECLDRRKDKTMQPVLFLFTSTLTVLGLGLTLLSEPLRIDSHIAYNELMMTCNTGARTEPLSTYYSVLLNKRLQPDCINKTSVEQCSGFQDRPPYTNFLKQMELEYACSGFCYQAASQKLSKTKPTSLAAALKKVTKDAGSDDYVGLLQSSRLTVVQQDLDGEAFSVVQITKNTFQQRASSSNLAGLESHQKYENTQGLFVLAANHNKTKSTAVWSAPPVGLGDTVNNMAATGWMRSYPPTLFTDANYKTTCEGAAARELRFSAGDAANIMHYEGVGLLLFSVVGGFIHLCALCGTKEVQQVEDTN